jgi:hypothetical protein
MLSNKCSLESIDAKARSIYADHIERNAAFEVHLPAPIKVAIQKELNFLHPDMFAEAAERVYDMMKDDSGARFMKTEEFQRIISKKNTGKKLTALATDRSTTT